jgi:Ni/Fe-hydrogenase subunit HybB-like protein
MISYSNWSVLTASFLVVLYLALGGVTLSAVLHLVGAQWRYEIRRLAVCLFALFPLAFILLIILLVGGENTFPWLSASAEHGHHLPAWHNYTFLVARQVLGMLAVMIIFWVFIKRQEVSDRSKEDYQRFHMIACWIPYTYVLYGTMVAWDFEMTLVPSWHSAIYGMQHFISNFNMFMAFLVTWIYMLNTRGKLVRPVEDYMYNYLAQMMFAFTLLWVYTFFAQYLVIWYPNLPGEVDRVMGMQNGDYSVLWWSMIILKLIIPFTVLAMRASRHSPPIILTVAASIIVGTMFERYIWISGVNGTGTMPVLAVLVVIPVLAIIGFLLVRRMMARNNLIKV